MSSDWHQREGKYIIKRLISQLSREKLGWNRSKIFWNPEEKHLFLGVFIFSLVFHVSRNVYTRHLCENQRVRLSGI